MSELSVLLTNLARLKNEESVLKAKIKHIQDQILERPDAPKKFDTSYGSLNLRKRDSWSKLKNEDVLESIGADAFFKYATFSVGSLKKVGGEQLVSDFIEKGKLELIGTTRYYALKQERK